jgi:hypothetical protein
MFNSIDSNGKEILLFCVLIFAMKAEKIEFMNIRESI